MIAQTFILIVALFDIGNSSPTTYEEDRITFYLQNRDLGDDEIQLSLENLNVVNASKKIYFLTHGYRSSRQESWLDEATEALLNKADYNVVQVDWSGPASEPDEATMILEARVIAKTFGKLLANLIDNYALSPDDVYLVGHSLGAHISGLAGQAVKEYSGVKVGTIKALDPANYLDIESASDEEKLTKDDANLLIVIHTAGGEAAVTESYGAVDFFPNGGSVQPCEETSYFCSHIVVTSYFVESIYKQDGFVSTQCQSYEAYESGLCSTNKKVTLGTDLTSEDEGDYYLDTNAESPYSKE